MQEKMIFAIYDHKAKTYGDFYLSPNKETAKREFQIAVNGGGMIGEFPEDFTLFHIGLYQHAEADIISLHEDRVAVCGGLSLVVEQQQAPAPFPMTNGVDWSKATEHELNKAAPGGVNGPTKTEVSTVNELRRAIEGATK